MELSCVRGRARARTETASYAGRISHRRTVVGARGAEADAGDGDGRRRRRRSSSFDALELGLVSAPDAGRMAPVDGGESARGAEVEAPAFLVSGASVGFSAVDPFVDGGRRDGEAIGRTAAEEPPRCDWRHTPFSHHPEEAWKAERFKTGGSVRTATCAGSQSSVGEGCKGTRKN